MGAAVELGRNPFVLMICDTDALIQIFCSKQESILKKLRNEYGIDSAVTEAVEGEMLQPGRKHATCCQEPFRKALESGLITVLDRRTLGKFTSSDPQTIYDSVQLRGQRYANAIGRGEAFSHASAHILRAAVLSNDSKALRSADRLGLEAGLPTLRLYDLIVFLFQTGDLTDRDCDLIRKSLFDVGDQCHSAFAGRKFTEGLPHFYSRLVLRGAPILGSPTMTELGDENRTELRKKADILADPPS